MALSTWWYDDPLPQLPLLPKFWAEESTDVQLLARLAHLGANEIYHRLTEGHRPYIAYLLSTPVAYGWVGTTGATIGELNLTFSIPTLDRYLWDFATLPEFRGRGIYPHLLQSIVISEMQRGVERFWIIYAPENKASGISIAKAGFHQLGKLTFLKSGGVGLVSNFLGERAEAGAGLFGVSLLYNFESGFYSECWQCVINTSSLACSCWTEKTEKSNQTYLCRCVSN